MNQYYLGGYYLVRLKPIDFGSQISKLVYTGSDCLNGSLLHDWSYSWVGGRNDDIECIKQDYLIDDATIAAIREWVDNNSDSIGWINVFSNRAAVREYKQRFFAHLPDLQIMAVYVTDQGVASLAELAADNSKLGPIGLCANAALMIPEVESDAEVTIGYDILGAEFSGGFHSFQCFDVFNDLAERFGLTLNSRGLVDEIAQWQPVIDYMNEHIGYERTSWMICKSKLVTD